MIPVLQQKLIALINHKYSRLTIDILVILSIGLIIALVARVIYLEKTLVPQWEKRLESKLRQQTVNINEFLDLNEKSANDLASDKVIRDFLKNPTDEEQIKVYLAKKKENLGFKNVLLIDPKTQVVFSHQSELQPLISAR